MSLPTKEQVRDALMHVIDPEIGINIVDLGLIREIEISDTAINVKMTMTTPACPLHAYLSKASEEAIRRCCLGCGAIHIEVVSEPAWEPAQMSEAARQHLGWVS